MSVTPAARRSVLTRLEQLDPHHPLKRNHTPAHPSVRPHALNVPVDPPTVCR